MNENSDLLPNLLHEEFEIQMRGYSRRQVDDFVSRRNSEIRELEQRLARALDESEHLRRELSTLRQQAMSGRPAHEEVSERISQILKLADDEARAQKNKAEQEIARQRAEAQQETDRIRAEAREQAERMLTAAQEQAERTISAARAEADKTRTAARTEADRLTGDTRKKADAALSQAKAQAKKVLDEATARASAIHDGAERRLNLLSTRHQETVRRLTDILDGVQALVAAEAARMSLEEEVNQSVSRAIGRAEAAGTDADSENTETADGDRDLSRLAPPAPETVAAGAAAPPRAEDVRQVPPARPGLAARVAASAATGGDLDPRNGPGPVSGGMLPPPSGARGPVGGPGGTTLPPPPPPPLPGAPSGPADRNGPSGPADRSAPMGPNGPGSPADRNGPSGTNGPGRLAGGEPAGGFGRPPLPVPGSAVPGLADPLADREASRDQPGRPGLTDPDEPTEGFRLLP